MARQMSYGEHVSTSVLRAGTFTAFSRLTLEIVLAEKKFSELLDLRRASNDTFEAPVACETSGRMYGGQFLAQGVAAAQLTVADDRSVNSLHAYFLRPGDVDIPTTLRVERVRDGRGYSSRSVSTFQSDREVFRMLLSFQVPQPGPEFSARSMPAAPAPDSVKTLYTDFVDAQIPADEAPWHGALRPMDIRYVNPPDAPAGTPVIEPQLIWMRIDEPLGAEQNRHDAGLTYLADSTLIDHVVLPHGHRWNEPGFDGTSLDHSMWFHRRARADEWLLFDQTPEATACERGLASGRFYNQAGELVATCMQEGLLRWAK